MSCLYKKLTVKFVAAEAFYFMYVMYIRILKSIQDIYMKIDLFCEAFCNKIHSERAECSTGCDLTHECYKVFNYRPAIIF